MSCPVSKAVNLLFTDFGQVTSPQVSSTSLPADSQQGSPGDAGYEIVTSYNQQGFPEIITQQAGAATGVKSYNEQGFLITSSPTITTLASPTALADSAASSPIVGAGPSASQKITKVVSASVKGAAWKAVDLGILSAGWLLAILLVL